MPNEILTNQVTSLSGSVNISPNGPSSLIVTVNGDMQCTQIATPPTPPAGFSGLYFKSDNKLYQLTSAGVETQVGGGGGIAVGSAITGGTNTRLLYQDAGGLLAQNASLTYDANGFSTPGVNNSGTGDFSWKAGGSVYQTITFNGGYQTQFTQPGSPGATITMLRAAFGIDNATVRIENGSEFLGNNNNWFGLYTMTGGTVIKTYPFKGGALGTSGLRIGESAGNGGTTTIPNYMLELRAPAAATPVYSQYIIPTTTGTTSASGTKAGLDAAGNFEIVNQLAGGLISLNAARVVITNSVTPASAVAAGVAGTVCWDANFVYVCVAANSWKRVAIAAW